MNKDIKMRDNPTISLPRILAINQVYLKLIQRNEKH